MFVVGHIIILCIIDALCICCCNYRRPLATLAPLEWVGQEPFAWRQAVKKGQAYLEAVTLLSPPDHFVHIFQYNIPSVWIHPFIIHGNAVYVTDNLHKASVTLNTVISFTPHHVLHSFPVTQRT